MDGQIDGWSIGWTSEFISQIESSDKKDNHNS